MKHSSFLFVASFVLVMAAGCSKEEAPPPSPPAAAAPAAAAPKPATEERLSKIPVIPGYKYYTGGPRMKADAYGRFRLSGFTGEVQQPPSRGMIFGAKLEGDHLEYRVWGNAIPLGLHRGVMRDGLFWQEYAEGYRDGKLVAREKTVNDDEAKVSRRTTEDIDPDNGEVIRTQEAAISYLPPEMPPEADVPDADDEDDAPAGAVPVPAVPSAPAPAAPAAPGAGK